MNTLILQFKKVTPLCLIVFALGCLALLPRAQALLPPPAPDGGYPNQNTAEGDDALFNLTTGANNTANGFNALFSNRIAYDNTATGAFALFNNITGIQNTANGVTALYSNTHGSNNTANGAGALFGNTTGSLNTATGAHALGGNGSENTATGFDALAENFNGNGNTANGARALRRNTIGSRNTANGAGALITNFTGRENTATGFGALSGNTTGSLNTANGILALSQNTIGNNNTANGFHALFSNTTGDFNTANGFRALFSNTIGNRNIAFGPSAGANLITGSDNIDIGNMGVADESSTTRIGSVQTRTFIAGIRGKTTGNANAIPVLIDSAGQLGTMSSSRRFKEEIKLMDNVSEAILALKPVTFHYKSDATHAPQFGLIAEEVAAVNPDLVVRDEKGEIYSVRYEAVNAMLLNEFLKEHRQNEEQEKTIAELKSGMTVLAATVKEQAAQIQNVSAQLELSKPAPQTVLNNP